MQANAPIVSWIADQRVKSTTPESMKTGAIKTFLIGTHGHARGLTLHEDCRDLLQANRYAIEIDEPDTKQQPDGILAAQM